MRVKSEERRQAILEIAKDLFTTHGFDQTSMSAIAKQLGGSKATLYNYFSSKEEIFSAVMEDATKKQITHAFCSLSAERELKGQLIDFGINYLNSILSTDLASIYKMAITASEHSNIGRFFYENGPKTGFQAVANFFQAHIDAGTFIKCDTTLAAMQLKALLQAELWEPYKLGYIDRPDTEAIQNAVIRAIESFLKIYPEKNG
ncbi:TetR/AcrR family transcriptional regulator [Vibrio mangrovi]|uniref:Putative HTH-type transcriptional regulator YfiR n=1 Tax=Vibrio mangrovi TaxID=474394 RepID=A0A1Y6IT12_9VIBR|nr:TetR/AcrR family transcriptional regulator [Vibrio mangrovi]MDW6004497.1 TetR/AcrR family transcriptional regulator [Vibrio mangrovi]SMS00785.1 putative HTH-type transcriptional regulator YfiR [Vibrio mangrovi]